MLDAHFARPSSPPSTPPDDLACLLQATSLAADPEACIVVVESPGRVPELHALLTPLCTSLAARYRLGDWFWIGEREGAAMLANELGRRPPQLSGVVLVLGGGLAPDAVAALGAFPVLGIAAPEHPSAENLSRIGAAAKARAATGVTVESVEALPWPLAVPLSVDRIQQFVARHRTAAPR